jgi:polyferredoxin
VVFFVLNFAMSFIEDVDVALSVLNLVKIFVPLLMVAGSVLGIIGGIGLLGYRNWARIMILVLSALDCLNVPIGTAKGVYSIWALLQDDTVELFNGRKEVIS